MGNRHTSGWCPRCKTQVLAIKETPNNILHLLLTLITFGAWIVIWFFAAVGMRGRGRCSKCGTEVKARAPANQIVEG